MFILRNQKACMYKACWFDGRLLPRIQRYKTSLNTGVKLFDFLF